MGSLFIFMSFFWYLLSCACVMSDVAASCGEVTSNYPFTEFIVERVCDVAASCGEVTTN